MYNRTSFRKLYVKIFIYLVGEYIYLTYTVACAGGEMWNWRQTHQMYQIVYRWVFLYKWLRLHEA